MTNNQIKETVKKWYELENGKIVFVEGVTGDVIYYRESPTLEQKVNMRDTIMNKVVSVSSEEEFNKEIELTLGQLDVIQEMFDDSTSTEDGLHYFERKKGGFKGYKSFLNNLTRVDVQKALDGKIKLLTESI